ncbi:hypothetical protein Aple_071080 [Acrocarpospora pleiomorpha]|uniref:DUF4258 domain-containing protein n=1 Tax=Acrocarpospora pleiomorpha TaxID=90975 RepID=A0A5M3XVX5_9ACTN|nr:hypothetical protein [Acrocarpospora pleiomorpha]GES24209.1 hypothetical protein Aple_071080 [Acrocarpospora pleiomorpha]
MSKPYPIIELPLDWDEANLGHAQRHGVTREEIEQVVRNEPDVYQSRKNGEPIPDHYLLVGVTDAGRRVTVVVLYPVTKIRDWGEYEMEIARPITAYDTPKGK